MNNFNENAEVRKSNSNNTGNNFLNDNDNSDAVSSSELGFNSIESENDTSAQNTNNKAKNAKNSGYSEPLKAEIVNPGYNKNILSIKQLQVMKRNTNLLSYALCLIGLISGYAALSGTKYPLQNFCYFPDRIDIKQNDQETDKSQQANNETLEQGLNELEDFKIRAIAYRSKFQKKFRKNKSLKYKLIVNRTVNSITNYCKNGETIYTTHPNFLLTSDNPVANSEFTITQDKYKIPAINRLDLDIIQPSNPNYLIYSIFSCLFTFSGFMLYSQGSKKYLELFPVLFEQHKTFTLETQINQTEARQDSIINAAENLAIKQHVTQTRLEYVKEKVSQEYDNYKALDYSQNQIDIINKNAEKQETLNDLNFRLQVAAMLQELAEKQLSTAKSEKELNKIIQVLPEKNTKLLNESDAKKERIDKIKNVLKDYEDGWILKVIEFRKPLYIIGGMGSGKSTLASCLVLLRHFLLDCPLELLIDAHAQVNRLDSWQELINIFGKDLNIIGDNNNYYQIGNAFENAISDWALKMPKFKNKEIGMSQILVDEYSNLSDKPECSEQAANFAKQSLSDPRKAGCYVICISHFDTQTGLGNKSGTVKARNTQTIRIERKSANGETPLANVTINGLPDEKGNLEEFEGLIPEWFRPEKIAEYFKNGTDIFKSVQE
jgi:hypothetical protein